MIRDLSCCLGLLLLHFFFLFPVGSCQICSGLCLIFSGLCITNGGHSHSHSGTVGTSVTPVGSTADDPMNEHMFWI